MGYSVRRIWPSSSTGGEKLRTFPKVLEGDREKLKALANLLKKYCVFLVDVGQSSSLDSVYVLMKIVNKLPVNLKRAWIKFSARIESECRR